MTETDILTVRNDLTEIVISVVSVSFAMISGYIAGLWLFLKNAPFGLRLLSFFMLSIGLAFMGALTVGVNDLLIGTEKAWSKLGTKATEVPGFGSEAPSWLYGFTLYEAAGALGALAFLGIYLALFYLTFLFAWPEQRDVTP
jgi:hypothetical protein